MFPYKSLIFLIFYLSGFVPNVRANPVEGSRLLDQAFRDYDKRIRPNFGGPSLPINVSMHLLSISEVNTRDMTYSMTFYIRQRWTDLRLSFNSRSNTDAITLDAHTSDRIWVPDTFFVNEISSVKHDVFLNNQFCRISRNGEILFSRRLTITAFSPMSSTLFPYDSHELNLHMESYGSQTKDLKYQWAVEDITTSAHYTPGFYISSLTAKDASLNTTTGSYSRLTIEIEVRRNPLPYELGFMLTTFILSLLCLCSTSVSVNPIHGTILSIYLVSLLIILYGLLVLLGFQSFGISASVTVLQIYILLSGAFCLLCVSENMRRNWRKPISLSSQKGSNTNGAFENKSRTESASDNCKTEEHETGTEELDNTDCSVNVNADDETQEKGLPVGKSPRKGKVNLGLSPRSYLWIAFVATNILFVLLCRLIR